jgi:hypothetical protein
MFEKKHLRVLFCCNVCTDHNECKGIVMTARQAEDDMLTRCAITARSSLPAAQNQQEAQEKVRNRA